VPSLTLQCVWWGRSLSPHGSVQRLEEEGGLVASCGCMVVVLLQPLLISVFIAVVKLQPSSSFCSRSRKLSLEVNNISVSDNRATEHS